MSSANKELAVKLADGGNRTIEAILFKQFCCQQMSSPIGSVLSSCEANNDEDDELEDEPNQLANEKKDQSFLEATNEDCDRLLSPSCSESDQTSQSNSALNSPEIMQGDQLVAQNYTKKEQQKEKLRGPNECHTEHRQQQQQQQQQRMQIYKEPKHTADTNNNNKFEQVKHVDLFGFKIVALSIDDKDRLCLAQISNTLLKDFSYNEIHNRRVALGITCVQCTPIQLEMLRRAGAMPSSSRRCGMITMREAERLCRSFLAEEQPPELPESFYFTVAHRVNYGCKGRFVPARYISSRAKCIECFYCGEFYSPNKFIFHSHKQPFANDCNPPDSPNINSWRKHIDLDWTQEHNQEIKYAWEDVKSLFNGGTRRRMPPPPQQQQPSAQADGAPSCSEQRQTSGSRAINRRPTANSGKPHETADEIGADESELVVDVCESSKTSKASKFAISAGERRKMPIGWPLSGQQPDEKQCARQHSSVAVKRQLCIGQQQQLVAPARKVCNPEAHNRPQQAGQKSKEANQQQQQQHRQMGATHRGLQSQPARTQLNQQQQSLLSATDTTHNLDPTAGNLFQQRPAQAATSTHAVAHETQAGGQKSSICCNKQSSGVDTTTQASFIYNQLYSQLIQSQQQHHHHHLQQQQQQQHQHHQGQRPQTHLATIETQLALRHQIWSSLLANLQAQPTNSAAANSVGLALMQNDPAGIYHSKHQAPHSSHQPQAASSCGELQLASPLNGQANICDGATLSSSATLNPMHGFSLFPGAMQMYSTQNAVESLFGDQESATN